jgi:predicted transcriptional regulator
VGVTKLTVNLPDETVQDLREYAENHGITMTEALRRFITRGKYFDDEIQNGGKVLVEKEDKTLREVVLG